MLPGNVCFPNHFLWSKMRNSARFSRRRPW